MPLANIRSVRKSVPAPKDRGLLYIQPEESKSETGATIESRGGTSYFFDPNPNDVEGLSLPGGRRATLGELIDVMPRTRKTGQGRVGLRPVYRLIAGKGGRFPGQVLGSQDGGLGHSGARALA